MRPGDQGDVRRQARLAPIPDRPASRRAATRPEASVSEAALQSVSGFVPDKVVGPAGAWAWARPDQTERRRVGLAPGLPLDVVEARLDGWLLVRSQSGWYGWTGALYLTEAPGAPNQNP